MDYTLMKIYKKLFSAFGPQYWWPGNGPFEVMVGAILTQNTNWANVEKAINNIKKAGALSPFSISDMRGSRLAKLIRPAGYYNIKAKRLKSFVRYFVNTYSGSASKMKKAGTSALRIELLDINGIGPETADSMLLYALDKPQFVIDAYTKRILSRHGIMDLYDSYENFQELFHSKLQYDVRLFNEYHALLVRVGKEYCRPKPKCKGCPLEQ
jgi:endonuclease-3 related protein